MLSIISLQKIDCSKHIINLIHNHITLPAREYKDLDIINADT